MTETQVLLDTVIKVKEFVNACNNHHGKVDVFSGGHIVDGKSILGVLSLDLATPIKVKFDGEIEKEVRDAIAPLVVDWTGRVPA